MKIAVIFILAFFVLNLQFSHAGKNDKKSDKHKVTKHNNNHHRTTPSHQTHKNHTANHHQNHTDPHAVNSDNIGWSLNNNNQPQHHNNPNGYALQSHDGSHHSQHTQSHPQHHESVQPVQQQPAQGSGIGGTLLGAGVGMAGGALGGYMLANALNSGGSAEKVKEEQATVSSETTIQNSIAPEQSTIAALEASASEATTVIISEEQNSVLTNETSLVPEIQAAPVTLPTDQNTSVIQDVQTTTQITNDNNNSVDLKISLNIIIFSTLFLIFSK